MFLNRNTLQKLFVIFGMLLYAVVLYIFEIGCPILRFIGIPCPGCGMTRAWLSVLRGDIVMAFSYHAMFWALPILVLMLWCDGNLFPKKEWNTRICIGIAVGFLLNWLYKLLIY